MYIVMEIQKGADGEIATIVTAFETEAEAFSKWHAVLSVAAQSTVPMHGCVMMRETGEPMRHEYYIH